VRARKVREEALLDKHQGKESGVALQSDGYGVNAHLAVIVNKYS
jgi:hypothetical protein